LQIGSPLASLYLLGNPDHYTNMQFKIFWWKSYVTDVKNSWKTSEQPADEFDDELQALGRDDDQDAEINYEEHETVMLRKNMNGYVGTTNVDDYKFRPESCERICLYDYIQMYSKVKRTKKQLE
ncbi:hypothetical protein R3P38DRAFT_2366934, partial [Favolaschia claudopus]